MVLSQLEFTYSYYLKLSLTVLQNYRIAALRILKMIEGRHPCACSITSEQELLFQKTDRHCTKAFRGPHSGVSIQGSAFRVSHTSRTPVNSCESEFTSQMSNDVILFLHDARKFSGTGVLL